MKTIIALLISLQSLSQIPKDKQLHFGAGAVIAGITRPITNCESKNPFLWSMLFVVGTGLAKEIKDEIDYGGFDPKDLGATILGGLVVNVTFEIFKNK